MRTPNACARESGHKRTAFRLDRGEGGRHPRRTRRGCRVKASPGGRVRAGRLSRPRRHPASPGGEPAGGRTGGPGEAPPATAWPAKPAEKPSRGGGGPGARRRKPNRAKRGEGARGPPRPPPVKGRGEGGPEATEGDDDERRDREREGAWKFATTLIRMD